MNFADEQRIARAIRQRDAAALADAVSHLPRYDREYDEVVNVIESAGGSRYVRVSQVRMDNVTIEDHLGDAVVRG